MTTGKLRSSLQRICVREQLELWDKGHVLDILTQIIFPAARLLSACPLSPGLVPRKDTVNANTRSHGLDRNTRPAGCRISWNVALQKRGQSTNLDKRIQFDATVRIQTQVRCLTNSGPTANCQELLTDPFLLKQVAARRAVQRQKDRYPLFPELLTHETAEERLDAKACSSCHARGAAAANQGA